MDWLFGLRHRRALGEDGSMSNAARAGGQLRLALVSGGSGAIGRAICEQLHDDGWIVAIGYVSQTRAEELAATLDTPDVPALAVPLNMSDPVSIRSGIDSLLDRFGRIDAAVFNGGIADTAPFVETTEDAWWAEVQVNMIGPMLATKLCLPGMIEAGRGVLIGISSDSAKVGDVGHAPYAAAKAGLTAFLKTIVREHGRHGVRASSVAPGPIDTPMLRGSFGTPEQAELMIDKLRRLVPLRRIGEPQEVAAAVRFLCSDGEYVAGEHLSVGGGVSMN
jgi:2-hydroxycyclohexanecarboxyl-CoA dehydrogenase